MDVTFIIATNPDCGGTRKTSLTGRMSRSQHKIPISLQRLISQQARHRCGYCLTSEVLIGMAMEYEHLIPIAIGGQSVEENLWLSCRPCNGHKGARTHGTDPLTNEQVPLLNPRTQAWLDQLASG